MRRSILAVICACAVAAPLMAQSGKTDLASLIEAGNHKAALEKIRAGADVNEAQPDGTRPIQWAVYRLDHELLAALIAKKARVNVANEFGSTPIAQAVQLDDAAAVKMLLDAGAEPEGANQDGQTALMLAIRTGDIPVVEMLLKAGANVNTVEKFDDQTPLMWAAAAATNAGEMVKLLLAKGASVKPRAKFTDWPAQITSEPRAQYRPVGGLNALMYAARGGCYACVEQILGAGADVNLPTPEGVTPLMIAIDNDHNDVARLLLARGANPDLWDWWGRTALYIAVDRKEAVGSSRGGRAPQAARASSRPPVSSLEIITALLAADVNPSPQLNMHRPSRGGNSGRFTDNQLSTGCTPLFRAVQGNDTEVIQALLAKGASPNINAMGFTPFLQAAGASPSPRGGAAAGAPSTAVLDLMIQHGADVNAQISGTRTYSMRVSRSPSGNEGQSALYAAVQSGRADLVRFLLDRGIDPGLVDSNGRKAIDLLTTAGTGRGGPSAATVAGIRAMLQNAPGK